MDTKVTDRRVGNAERVGHTPSEMWMWLFILGDMSIFALFFGTYLWDFSSDRDKFISDGTALILPLGFTNTIVLLTSSFFVVRAVELQRLCECSQVKKYVAGSLVGAGTFIVLKFFEYALELVDGNGLTSSIFFMYYFVLTGLHLMHVAIGTTLLAAWARSLPVGRQTYSMRWVEGAAGYWHMVDLLWLIIFALLYLGSHT